jgi:hypothetical protein
VLAIQGGLFGFQIATNQISPTEISVSLVLILVAVSLIILSVELIIKSYIGKYEKLNLQGGKGNRVKHNPNVFANILKNQSKINRERFDNEMVVGNSSASLKIIFASNLFCNPCKLMHEVVSQLFTVYPETIQISFRFVRSSKEPDCVSYLLNYWFQTIKGKEDENFKTLNLMHDWFEIWDFEIFKKKYQLLERSQEMSVLEAEHFTWTDEYVSRTPTFFINEYEMPKEYTMEDLLAMVPNLVSMIEKSVETEIALA